MTEGIVVDASVTIKWVVAEVYAVEAQALYEDTVAAHHPLFVPPHLVSEVVNGLYRRMRRSGPTALTEDEVTAAVERLLTFPLQPETPPTLYEEAFTFAKTLPALTHEEVDQHQRGNWVSPPPVEQPAQRQTQQ